MDTETPTKENAEAKVDSTPTEAPVATESKTDAVSIEASDKSTAPTRERNARTPFKKNRRNTSRRRERVKSEFDQKILSIRRVTRVAAGGRRFTFSVSIVIGNRKGKIGVGVGKAGDTTLAIEKAVRNANRNLIVLKMTEDNSIPHEVKAKFTSSQVLLMPAPGRGIIAGSSVRDCVELAGLNHINAKIISGSKNKLNNAQATLRALKNLSPVVNNK